jgi:hypothetical protein
MRTSLAVEIGQIAFQEEAMDATQDLPDDADEGIYRETRLTVRAITVDARKVKFWVGGR